MSNEGNQIHNFISSSGSRTLNNYGSGSGYDFLTGYGSGSASQKVTVRFRFHNTDCRHRSAGDQGTPGCLLSSRCRHFFPGISSLHECFASGFAHKCQSGYRFDLKPVKCMSNFLGAVSHGQWLQRLSSRPTKRNDVSLSRLQIYDVDN